MSVPPASEHTHGPFAGPYSSCPACQPPASEAAERVLEALSTHPGRASNGALESFAALEARLAEATELCDDMFTSIENLAQIANLSGAVEEILTQFGYPLNHNLAHFAERRAALPPESAEG